MSNLDYQPAYRRNLPHLQPAGATFFVTFRLAGSLPQEVLRQFKREQQWLAHLARNNPDHYEKVIQDFERVWFKKFETLLDGATFGPVWLKDDRVASIVAESLHYRDGGVYRLDAFTIMANHVHTVIKPLPRFLERDKSNLRAEDVEYYSLASIMQSLKGYTAFYANQVLGREGEFWAHESYERSLDTGFRRVAARNRVCTKQSFESWLLGELEELEVELSKSVSGQSVFALVATRLNLRGDARPQTNSLRYRSFAHLNPETIQRSCAWKKFRYVERMCSCGVANEPPRRTF